MTRTIFIEVEIGKFFSHGSVYYTKIDEHKGVRRSLGGEQPHMRQEVVFHPFSEVLTNIREEDAYDELNNHGIKE
jgi:hypothetical protein